MLRRVVFAVAMLVAGPAAADEVPRAPDAPDVQPPTGAAAPDPPEAITEVVVQGARAVTRAPRSDTLARSEVRQLPGAFGDPFRAIEVTPGFTPVLSGLPYFYVRGAPPGNVGYYFDGVRVPYLFHFGLGPAVIHPALIGNTEVQKGGYPAALGRFAGGVVNASSLPPSERARGEGQLRLIDAGFLVETPFANGRGSALAAARYSYTAALFSLFASDTTLDYRDYQARVSYDIGSRDRITVLAFGAYDFASQKDFVEPSTVAALNPGSARPAAGRQIERVLFASEFHRVDLRWDHTFGESGLLRVAGTVGFDRTKVEARRAAQDLMLGARASLEQRIARSVMLRAGVDLTVDDYDADALPRYADDDDVVARQERIFATRKDFAAAAWVDAVMGNRDYQLVPGIRADVFGSDTRRAASFDPRLAGRFRVGDSVHLVHAVGLATQPPSTPVTLPAVTLARLEGGLQRSFQTSAGVEVELPLDISASGTIFHQAFFDLNDALGTAQIELVDLEKSDSLLEKSSGSAYGLEVGMKRKLSNRLGGLVAYTLSRSERTASGSRFVSSYDRTHVGNVALSYDLGRNWRLGGRYVFYTGTPVRPTPPAFAAQAVGRAPDRTPLFMRLDVRLEKRWTIGERGFVSIVLEALNATLSSEVTGYRCSNALALPLAPAPRVGCVERTVGPVSVPSLGVEGGF